MKIIINNTSDESVSYASGAVIVAAAGTLDVDYIYWKDLIQDPKFMLDISLNNIDVTDGSTDYTPDKWESLLSRVNTFLLQNTISSLNDKVPNNLTVTGGRLQVELPAGGSGLTDTELRATPVPISGSVTANTGLSQPLTDAELRATPVPISGSITVDTTGLATDAGQTTGNTSLSSIDTKLSGTIAVSGPLTDTQIRATPLPISGTVTIDTTGLATDTLQTSGNSSLSSIDTKLSSQSTGAKQDLLLAELQLKADLTETQPVSIAGSVAVTGPLTDTQLRLTPIPVSGTVTANTGLAQPLTDTELRATAVPISASSLPLPTGASTSALQNTIDTSINTLLKPASTLSAVTTVGTVSTITNVVHVDDNAGSLTVDGTVAATQSGIWNVTNISGTVSLPTGAATETTVSAINTKLPSGLTVTGSRLQVELPAGGTGLTDTELRATPVPVSGTVSTGLSQPLTDTQLRAVAVPVSGTVTVNALTNSSVVKAQLQDDSGTGITVGQQLAAASLPVILPAATITTLSTPVVSGTVTANIGSSGSLALDATLTGGTQKAIIRGGAKGATTAADITSTSQSADRNALDVQIRTSAGAVVDTFGGGTQYADGAAKGSSTGTLMMVDDGTNIQSAAGTTAGVLKVDLSSTTANSTAIKVDGSAVTQPINTTSTATGSMTGAGTIIDLDVTGYATATVSISGTWSIGTIFFTGSVDGVVFIAVSASNALLLDGQIPTTAAANGLYRFDVTGLKTLRLEGVSITGTAEIRARTSLANSVITAIQAPIYVLGGDITATAPSITKGTQGATGFTTQDLKDAGRTAVMYYATAVAAGTTGTETAITLTKSSGTGATSTGASQTPTSGKKFRITAITFASRGHSTGTAQVTTFKFRINTGGGVTTGTTPIVLSMRSATPATASAWDRIYAEIPDGWEIAGDGTLQFGITANAVYTTNAPTWDVTIIGYEY